MGVLKLKYLAIAGIVLLLIFGAWALLKGRTPKLPYVAGKSPYRAGGGPGEEGQDKSGQGVMPPEEWQEWWGSLDAANEAGTKAIGKVLEDLSVYAPGSIIRWRRSDWFVNVLQNFNIGRAALKEEADRSPSLPGFIIPSTGAAYVPIEVTWPYSWLKYDREKYLILINSTRDEDNLAEIEQNLIIWDRKNRAFLPDLSSVSITQPEYGQSRQTVWDSMARSLVGRQFGRMPRGRHGEQLWLRDQSGWLSPSHNEPLISIAGRIAQISHAETMFKLRSLPVATFA